MKVLVYVAAVLAICCAQDLGYIKNFRQKSNDIDFVLLEWDFVEGDSAYPLHKYTLVTDNDFREDVRCPVQHCEHTVEYLIACDEYDFTLIPVFDDTSSGETIEGTHANVTGYTSDKPPGAPRSLEVLTDDDVTLALQWQEPLVNPMCVHHYQVCFRLVGEGTSECNVTEDTTLTRAALRACGNFHVTVTPLTPSNSEGYPLQENIVTRDGTPGTPLDVTVGIITQETIDLKWNNPDVNPLCVSDYTIKYGETHTRALTHQMKAADYENHATLSPLDPCTNYTITISAVGLNGYNGPSVTNYAATEETEPDSLPSVVAKPGGTDAIDVSWGANEDDSCAGHFQICWVDGVHPVEICENITTGGDNNFTITDLLPCTHYDIAITVVSPGGLTSIPTNNATSTQDVAPGPVVDLKVKSISTDQLTITYDPPRSHPQCVKEYDIEVIDQDQTREQTLRRVTPYMDDTITGLKACTHYLVKVRAVSPTGKKGPWVDVTNVTSVATPSEPQVFGMSDVTETSISLQWFQPATNPRCATQYVLQWEGDGTSESVTISGVSDFKLTYTVEGLKACVEYTFTVKAKSSTDESAPVQLTQSTRC
ncbi:fibronectin-like [Panulirus ornatus]|uniref:fibronectin-like n=1 Tax=Panulirus ornatus TaxID=150431 RepID=UPI003A873444